MTATTAMPAHTTRHDASRRSTMPVDDRAEHTGEIPQRVEAHELAGLRRERVGRRHVEHDVEQAAGRDREDERGHEQRDVRGEAFDHEERTPDDDRTGHRDARAPPVGDDAADRGEAGRGDDARREEEAELRVGEVERALDVDRGDRERARRRTRRRRSPRRRDGGTRAHASLAGAVRGPAAISVRQVGRATSTTGS